MASSGWKKRRSKLPGLEAAVADGNRFSVNTNLPVYISGDAMTRNGNMTDVLEAVRRVGVQKVAFMVAGTPLKQAISQIRSPIARKRTRLEIIPLIDIMFFLLASFMMVSLQMQKVRTIKAALAHCHAGHQRRQTGRSSAQSGSFWTGFDGRRGVGFCQALRDAFQSLQREYKCSCISQRKPRNDARRNGLCSGPRQAGGHPARRFRGQARCFWPVKMKNFQQNLFIALALGLCGLCAWQWYFQTVQRDRIDKLDQTIYKQSAQIQGYTNSIASLEAELAGHEGRINELKQTIASNSQEVITQKREVLRLKLTAEAMSNEIAQYQSLTNILASKLTEAYQGVKKQNEAISNLVAERDEFVSKYNESVKSRNDVVEKYNALVQQFKKFQDEVTRIGVSRITPLTPGFCPMDLHVKSPVKGGLFVVSHTLYVPSPIGAACF